MKLITRGACKRLAGLGTALLLLFLYGCATMIHMPLKSHRGPLPAISPEQKALAEALRRDVTHLAETIGERNVEQPAKLRAASEFIKTTFLAQGYQPRVQTFRVLGENCENIEVEIPGQSRPEEIVVVGAHYDSAPGTPGRTTTRAGCQLAGLERTTRPPARGAHAPPGGIRERGAPVFPNDQYGKLGLCKEAHQRGDRIVAMLSLETMGCYSDEANSQHYPAPFSLFYPSRGNFIGFVGNHFSRALVRECVRAYREETPFPSEGGALPSGVPGSGGPTIGPFGRKAIQP